MFKFFSKRRRKDSKPDRKTKQIEVDLHVLPGQSGEYDHRFSGPEVVNEEGDFDFTRIKGPVTVTIRISSKSERGVAFLTPADHAISLVPEKFVERGKCPGSGSYKTDQFHSFELSDNNTALTFVDRNNDGGVYFYALRFVNAKGCIHVYDPKVKNGHHD